MSGVDEPIDPAAVLRSVVEVCVFAPIGAAATLIDDAPNAVERVRQELSNARLVGRLAVENGLAHLREQSIARPSANTAEPRTAATEASGSDDDPADDALAIDDYDSLAAIDIVAQLDDLSPSEREAIAVYERAHRQRRTVLGKIEQLAAS